MKKILKKIQKKIRKKSRKKKFRKKIQKKIQEKISKNQEKNNCEKSRKKSKKKLFSVQKVRCSINILVDRKKKKLHKQSSLWLLLVFNFHNCTASKKGAINYLLWRLEYFSKNILTNETTLKFLKGEERGHCCCSVIFFFFKSIPK